jgi:hypothetical protein
MKRVNPYTFYQAGTIIHPLASIEQDASVPQIVWDLDGLRDWLKYLLSDRLVSIVVSRHAAQTVIDSVNAVIPEKSSDFSSIDAQRKLSWMEAYRIRTGLLEFETVFAAELPTFDAYLVSKKGIYSTADLIERAEMAIDETAREGISEGAQNDFKQAGKCLAFELPTACGFHAMRAVEAVLRSQWELVTKPAAGTRPPEMAQCINELRAKGEDPKLLDILDHIRDLHRNTTMHPEAFLTMIDALRLFDIAKSAMSAMGDRVRVLKPKRAALGGLLAVAATSAHP